MMSSTLERMGCRLQSLDDQHQEHRNGPGTATSCMREEEHRNVPGTATSCMREEVLRLEVGLDLDCLQPLLVGVPSGGRWPEAVLPQRGGQPLRSSGLKELFIPALLRCHQETQQWLQRQAAMVMAWVEWHLVWVSWVGLRICTLRTCTLHMQTHGRGPIQGAHPTCGKGWHPTEDQHLALHRRQRATMGQG